MLPPFERVAWDGGSPCSIVWPGMDYKPSISWGTVKWEVACTIAKPQSPIPIPTFPLKGKGSL